MMELRHVVDGPKRDAIRVRHAYKQYGNVRVLQDFNMTVQEGTIYGLLGASGCGKTTLLSCLVGRRQLESGHISVLGMKAGESNFAAVRKRIGYMPQDVALYPNFTIKETMLYFGWIFNMSVVDIEEKLPFWINLLLLPHSSKKVNKMSGGQKRRLSLAIALLHDPAVMILDEPTVGVDPVLRSVIWQHLEQLSLAGKTIIITTHYIEEAKYAHMIGMMRNGCLLAEESPEFLLHKYESNTLEDVFIRLSQMQELACPQSALTSSECQEVEILKTIREHSAEEFTEETVFYEEDKFKRSRKRISAARMSALLYKNCTSLWTDLGLMLYLFGQCLMLPLIVYYAFIGFPEDLRLAVVIDDYNSSVLGSGCIDIHPSNSCELVDLSCRFVSYLASPIFLTEFYSDTQLAADAVREGRAWGSLHFGENYTAALIQRSFPETILSDDVINQSNVDVRLDMTDYITSQHLKVQLYKKYEEFLSEIVISCGFNPKLVQIPLKLNDPVYGQRNPRNVDNFGAAMMLFIVHFFGVALSTPSIVFERKEGLLDRNIVAGVTTLEILLSHFLAQFLVLFCQVALILIFALYVFSLECVGSPLVVFALTTLVGASGLIFGFAISTFAQSEIPATLLANGCVLPLILLSGIVWPIEGMHGYLASAAKWLPLSLPVHAMRSVTARGNSLLHQDVYAGFLSATGWCLVFTLLCAVSVRFNKL